jgi:CheY-like chemotaxis protein
MIESTAAASADATEVATAPCALPDAAAPETNQPAAPASPANALDSPRLLLISSAYQVPPDLLLLLQAVGFDWDVCTIPQALPFLKSHAYHAAVVDVGAPEEAFSLIEQTRGISTGRQIPIVALVDPADVNSAFRAGASFAVPRPVTPDLLRNTLGTIYRIAVGLHRQYARYHVEIPLTLTVAERCIEGKATDIGEGGMALVASEPLVSGAILSVRCVMPGSEEQIVALGEIRWADHYGRAGFSFNSIAGTGRASLDNWLARRHAVLDHPVPLHAPATLVPRPFLANTADEAVDPARRTARLALSSVLVALCLFMIGFWIYIALTS